MALGPQDLEATGRWLTLGTRARGPGSCRQAANPGTKLHWTAEAAGRWPTLCRSLGCGGVSWGLVSDQGLI